MNVGETLVAGLGPFAQVMEYVPRKTVGRIIKRYAGGAGVRTLGRADLFRVMAFRTNNVAGILARYRSLPASQTRQAFSQGTPRRARALDVVRCVGPARLAHPWPKATPSCFGDAPDRACAGTLRHGTAGDRSGRDGLRARCDHDRFVSEPVRLGRFSFDQSRSQGAHAAGFARCYS